MGTLNHLRYIGHASIVRRIEFDVRSSSCQHLSQYDASKPSVLVRHRAPELNIAEWPPRRPRAITVLKDRINHQLKQVALITRLEGFEATNPRTTGYLVGSAVVVKKWHQYEEAEKVQIFVADAFSYWERNIQLLRNP